MSHDSFPNSHSPESLQLEWGISFGFMRRIADVCGHVFSEDVRMKANHHGRVYFGETENGFDMISRKDVDPTKHIGIRVENILRRTDFNYPGWPRMGANTLVEHVQIRWPKKFDDTYHLGAIETTSKMGNIRSLLADRKKEFSSRDVVERIERLEALDVIFVHFEEDGQLYSITVAEPSKEVNGKTCALCNVIYRVKDANGRYREAEAQGIMSLPLKVGEKMRFVKNGNTLVKELAVHRIKKLQHKSLKSTDTVQ